MERLFGSFFLAGFECTSALLPDRVRLHHRRATGHDVNLLSDYARLRALGIRAVREGVSWPHVRRGESDDLDWVRRVADAAQRNTSAWCTTCATSATPTNSTLSIDPSPAASQIIAMRLPASFAPKPPPKVSSPR